LPSVILALVAASALDWVVTRGLGLGAAAQAQVASIGWLPAHTLWDTGSVQRFVDLLWATPRVLPYALAIAAFATLDALLSMAMLEAVHGQRLETDPQLMRQGWVNVVGGLLGATPVLAAVSRVSILTNQGGRRRASGLVYALTLVMLVSLGGALLGWIAPAATGGVLLVSAFAMVDDGTRRMLGQLWHKRALRHTAPYRVLLAHFGVMAAVAVTMVAAGAVDALLLGLLAALLLFLLSSLKPVVRRVASGAQQRSLLVRSPADDALLREHGHRIAILELDGPLFFGTAERVALSLEQAATQADWLIVDCSQVKDLDATGARILTRAADQLHRQGKQLWVCALAERFLDLLHSLGGARMEHSARFFADEDQTLEQAENELLQSLGVNQAVRVLGLWETVLAQGLNDEQINVLAAHLSLTLREPGHPVFRRGETGGGLYMAVSAVVDIVVPAGTQRVKRVASVAPGNVFGEMALLDRQPRSADALIRQSTYVWELTPAAWERLSREHPDLASLLMFNLSGVLAARVRTTTQALSTLLASGG
jgi:SulP family sulfate permease